MKRRAVERGFEWLAIAAIDEYVEAEKIQSLNELANRVKEEAKKRRLGVSGDCKGVLQTGRSLQRLLEAQMFADLVTPVNP